ncbi:hypothetical protein [Shewanella salipaludis]|uniref:Uncharacterized protein n=1 Tax=Shewanella salipaludis TaxID=2723052 RepID=A0A972FSJ2_9GAMM|nr:hypothetical protein [Shewanella salipaludis]NMH64931.1 hypothetical protein [Shewanella salipaludis]
MIELGVSEFSMIAVTTGKPKNTKIRKIVNREPYAFYKDYYLGLRTAIKSIFTQKRHISYLYDVSRKQSNPTKKAKFEKISGVFKNWQSGKTISAYTPIRECYVHSATSINCNPELNVVLNGEPRLVKLHFNESEKMTQVRANIICVLIKEAVNDPRFEYSVLDLTTGEEFMFKGDYDKTLSRVNDEISNFEVVWNEYV